LALASSIAKNKPVASSPFSAGIPTASFKFSISYSVCEIGIL
jgi:hypothetical protein